VTTRRGPHDVALEHLRLELYIAGDTSNSRRARANLEAIVRDLGAPLPVDVIDVFQNPRAAAGRNIFATPSLIAAYAGHEALIVGDLSNHEAVRTRLESLCA